MVFWGRHTNPVILLKSSLIGSDEIFLSIRRCYFVDKQTVHIVPIRDRLSGGARQIRGAAEVKGNFWAQSKALVPNRWLLGCWKRDLANWPGLQVMKKKALARI